jgi:transmembrane protein TMEM260 (protein O-mannosyltransferase)
MARGVLKRKQFHKEKTRERASGRMVEGKSGREINPGTISLSRAELFYAGILFLVALLLFSWTLAPTVTVTDSGELIVVAEGLGVAHPPGFPLWVVLAHLASLVPLGNVAVRINFSSALFAALACAMLTLVVAELMIAAAYLPAWKRAAQQRKKTGDSRVDRLLVFAPALGAGLLMAFSRTLWSYATIAEVYTLNTLLILIVFFLMLRWRRCIIADRRDKGETVTIHDSWLYAAAAVFGLALGDHHVTVGLTLPAVAVVVYRTQGLRFFTSRRLIYAALISVAAMVAVYAYLPFAASRSPLINWGNPRSLQEIWWHITGRQYRVFLSFTPTLMGVQFVEFCRMLLREFGPAWLPLPLALAFAGFATAYRQDRTTFWFLLSIVIANLAYDLSYEIAEDKDAYYLPVFISVALAAGFGIRWLIQLTAAKSMSFGTSYGVAAAVVLFTSATAFAANWPFNNRRHYFIAHDYVENLLSAVGPNGLLLTQDWQVAAPMFYEQEVEQRRTDVKVVDVNLLRRSWYFDYLKRAHPDLVERSREKIDAYVENLKEWERDPGAFARSQPLTQKISVVFLEMIRSIVTNEISFAPVYITNDLLAANQLNSYLTQWIPQTYQLVPEGLVFYVASYQSFHDSPDLRLQTRGLADGTVRFEKDDVVNLKVLSAYTSMLINRGRYLAAFNQHARAIIAFKEALALDPNLAAAREGLAQSTAKLPSP